jgi:DNA-binding response OmpR family regulator
MNRTKARILHVDDHQDTRLLIAALLAHSGYGVLTAGTVAEGLQLAAEISFDLCILDVRLPDGNGVALCQQIRKLQPGVPTLYYSAYADETDQKRALSTCGDGYLKKPICIADLEEAIVDLLDRHRKSKGLRTTCEA